MFKSKGQNSETYWDLPGCGESNIIDLASQVFERKLKSSQLFRQRGAWAMFSKNENPD